MDGGAVLGTQLVQGVILLLKGFQHVLGLVQEDVGVGLGRGMAGYDGVVLCGDLGEQALGLFYIDSENVDLGGDGHIDSVG